MFKGTYRHRIDGKGRVPVPAAFRRGLDPDGGGRLVVTLFDQCLAVYPPREWQQLESQLRALPTFSGPAKALTRLLTSRAADCELDVQGRILLPGALREAAALEQAVVVVGVLDRFELWSPAAWDRFLEDSERLLEDAALGVQWPGVTAVTPTRPQGKPSR